MKWFLRSFDEKYDNVWKGTNMYNNWSTYLNSEKKKKDPLERISLMSCCQDLKKEWNFFRQLLTRQTSFT